MREEHYNARERMKSLQGKKKKKEKSCKQSTFKTVVVSLEGILVFLLSPPQHCRAITILKIQENNGEKINK